MELQHLNEFEQAVAGGRGELVRFGVSFLFLVGVMFYVASQGAGDGSVVLVMAAIVATYMAMNIGANDVANNVGPAVGAGAFSLVTALLIAAAFDIVGALVAGERVIERMRSGIIDPGMFADPQLIVWVMLAALLAGAVWINIASALGAPVRDACHRRCDHGQRRGRAGHRGRQLAGDGRHRGELGGVSPARRGARGDVPVLHQAQHHLSGGHGGGGKARGPVAAGGHGVDLHHLPAGRGSRPLAHRQRGDWARLRSLRAC